MTVNKVKASGLSDESRLAKNAAIKQALQATQEKRKQQVCRTFELKIQKNKLNNQQAIALKMLFIEAKWLYNSLISGESLNTQSVTVLNRDKVKENREYSYLGSQMKQSVVKTFQNNIKVLAARKAKGFKIGGLKYVSDYRSLDLKQYGNTYRFKNGKVKVQNIPGYLRISGLRQLKNYDLANAKLIQKNDDYFLVVTAYLNKSDVIETYQSDSVVGIDMGVSTHITTSNGEKLSVMIGETDRLKCLQRKFSKQVKGSNNYYKTKNLIRKEYSKLTNKKNDAANKVVHDLLQSEVVVLQDENLSEWRTRDSLARGSRAVQYSIMGRVKSKLKQSDRVIMIRKNAATTQTCICGKKNKHELSQRTYSCSCGYSQDRDIHAAQNMIHFAKNQIPVDRRDYKLVERTSDSFKLQYSLKQEALNLQV